MSEERQAIEQLEARLARLEAIVRHLARHLPDSAPEPPTPRAPAQSASPPVPPRTPRPDLRAAARTLGSTGVTSNRITSDLETWIGQRGLLAVGVVALIAAGGFFLTYAFERGWIPPLLRAAGAVVAGFAIALAGDRLVRRGLRRYGAALAGAGGALAYLGFWAAAASYALIPTRVALGLLFITTTGVAFLAARHRVEPLAWWALVGAYLAPFFLADRSAGIEVLLAYLLVVAIASGGLALRFAWRGTFAFTVIGYFFLPAALAIDQLGGVAGVVYAGVGAVAVLVARSTGWSESRFFAVAFAWWLLIVQRSDSPTPALVTAVVTAGVLAVVVWWQHRARDPVVHAGDGLRDSLEALLFVTAPLALVLWSARRSEYLGAYQALVPALAGVLYLAGGWVPRRASLVGMGVVLLALAAAARFDGPPVAVAWVALAAAAAASDRWLDQRGAGAVAPALGVLGAVHLFTAALAERPGGAPAFSDAWSWGWYGVLAGLMLTALARRETTPAPGPGVARQLALGGGLALWSTCGAAVFGGGALELRWAFASRFAGDLATSAFWLIYAGALVALGFGLERKAVRSAGLVVAGVAIVKIALYDLESLEALYRVGSLFVLALIALGVAYGYNRRAAERRGTAV